MFEPVPWLWSLQPRQPCSVDKTPHGMQLGSVGMIGQVRTWAEG
jgi:hypothetical protein